MARRECDRCDRFRDPERMCAFYNTGAYCKYQEPPYRGPEEEEP